MGETSSVIAVIITVTLATQVSRLGPLFFSKFELSKSFEAWLSQVPIAILTALLVPEFIIITAEGLKVNYLYVASAILCFFIGIKFKNLLLTTLIGVLSLAMCRMLEF